MKQKILKRLQTRLEHELQHNFYYCGSPECPRVTFEDAMDIVFHCPTCNVSLKSVDNTSTILFLENKIADIEKEVKN